MPRKTAVENSAAFHVLRKKGWFAEIAPRFRSALAAEAVMFSAETGETIFHFGDSGAGLFGVATGSFRLSVPREDGSLLPVLTLGAGFWLGDQAALSGKPGLVSIEIRESVTGLHIPAERVRRLVRDMPEIYEAFYQLNRINLRLALRLMAALAAETAVEKLALRLLILSEYSDHHSGWMTLTSEDLAAQIGLSVPSIRRALKALADIGFLERRYARVRIRNPDRIADLRRA